MKCTIPEVSWHNREPVLSIDIHPLFEKFYRLATGGADCHVLIWQLNISDNGAVKMEALSDLTRHQKAVNCVRWSPTGQFLATADDDANIIVWHLKTDNIPLLEGDSGDKEVWVVNKVMRGHKEDIYDLCWSPNGLKLLSGSIDNTAILWDFSKGKMDLILSDHKGFVQGVAWDPKGQYVATISTDRICRIFDSTGRQVKARLHKGQLPVPEKHYLHSKDVKLFHDDTFKSFFRRLDFSPDGTLLVTPSGHVEIEDSKKVLNATYVFAVETWTGPVACLPTNTQCSTVVRFCPILFELHEDGPEAVLSLPYRMIVAVGTDHDVILYDTQQLAPFAYFRDIHYTRLTDLTWSNDGQLLIASSTDGFCALITFEPEELGTVYVKEDSEAEENPLNVSGCEELEKEVTALEEAEAKAVEVVVSKPKKPNLLEKWAIKTPKRTTAGDEEGNKNVKEEGKDQSDVNTVESTAKRKLDEDTGKTTPKRIKPIPVPNDASAAKASGTQPTSAVTKVFDKTIARPIAVRRKPREPENSAATAAPPAPKQSPLLSFLKTTPKEKTTAKEKTITAKSNKPQSVSVKPEIVLGEIEARDAWDCEKENKVKPETVISPAEQPTPITDCSVDFTLQLEDTSTQNCTQDTEPAKKESEDSAQGDKTKVQTPASSVTPASNGPAKQKVPLITLSSPKQKKK